MNLFYPNNFPKQYEDLLLNFLTSFQNSQSIYSLHSFKKSMYRFFSRKQIGYVLSGKTPPFWWFQFLLMRYRNRFKPFFVDKMQQLLIKTKTRSLSGIVPLTVFTKGVGCPFHCVYCPNETGVPKSYLSDEPAVMRAVRNSFRAFKQTRSRLLMFSLSGHPIGKIELIIKGGTFSFFSHQYRRYFVKRLFDAANTNTKALITEGTTTRVISLSLHDAQRKNEKAHSRIVGINIETRPDYINQKELRFLRTLGVTHIEIGVQNPDNHIYTLIKRGHVVEDVVRATQLAKDAGFKIGYHLMPNLPGSSPEIDKIMLQNTFIQNAFKPDHLKLYPTTITKHTSLSQWYQKKRYKPYQIEKLIPMLAVWKSIHVPVWVRIGRLTRDISTQMMTLQAFPPNLREMLQSYMKKRNLFCRCIRCREIQNNSPTGSIKIRTTTYDASHGKEFFIEAIDAKERCLGFIRLRLPSYLFNHDEKPLFKSLRSCCLVRELHVYGKSLDIGTLSSSHVQHRGLGELLLEKAESIAQQHNLNIAVISGIGVRAYYRKKGYKLLDTYMIKRMKKKSS